MRVEVGGLEIVDGLGPWTLMALGGWHDGVAVRSQRADRPQAHGTFATRGWRSGRAITVAGEVHVDGHAAAAAARNAITACLADGTFGDMRVTDPDGTVTSALVQLDGKPLVTWGPNGDVVVFDLQFYAPDPLRYGDPVALDTGFPKPGGGLRFPLFTDGAARVGFLDFGAPGTSGRITLTNHGTAAGHPQYTVVGPVPPEGFDIVCVETGERITFSEGVSAGSTLVLDSATGRVLLNGDGDKSGALTRADWFTVPPGGTCTIAFLNRGASSDAVLTATLRPSWW